MTKRRIIFMSGLCFLMAFLALQAFSQTRDSNGTARLLAAERRRNMSDADRKREAAKNRKELKSKKREPAKEGASLRAKIEAEERQKEAQEKWDQIKRELLNEKRALAVTEEQWKLIKPKLERVRELRDKARSTVGLSLASSSAGGESPAGAKSQSIPTWQWNISWEDKAPVELSEAQKNAEEIITLLDKKNATPEEFKQKIDALRESRAKQKKLEERLSKAREELRKGLTPRQEAALVLMRWL